jgi:hypothetical protein
VADEVGVSLKTVRKWKGATSIADAPRKGRPKVLTEAARQFITASIRNIWGASIRRTTKELNYSEGILANNCNVSPKTVERFVRSTEWGRTAYRARKSFMLTTKNIQDRLAFCSKVERELYCSETENGKLLRENILFTDESIIELFPPPNGQNMRIRTNDPSSLRPFLIPKHGLKIMVCGGMTSNGVTDLHVVPQKTTINGEYYRSHVLPIYFGALAGSVNTHLPGSIFTMPPLALFMQDGAPAHSTNINMQLIGEHFPSLWAKGVWPGSSPDLNPIEHVWKILQDSVFIQPRPTNRQELIQRVREAWFGIPSSSLFALVESFPRRIAECVERHGRETDY